MATLAAGAAATLLLVATALAQAPPGGGKESGGGGDKVQSLEDRHRDAVNKDVEAAWARSPVAEKQSVTKHTLKTATGQLRYTATAGTLTIRNDDGKPTASVFYVAYALDGAAPTSRPVTFFYNGGPGSSSVWLHMGSFGPMRVQTTSPETIRPAPFNFGPNPDTLLDRTDLVFIDMIGAGFSRALPDTPPTEFWGVDQDADAFARIIMRWTTKNSRWTSPKFLFGESYGTLRSAALAYQLEDRGMALNGVILLSTILNYGVEQKGYDTSYIGYLPSYAAAAWYHQKVPDRPADLSTFVQKARDFALGPYASALAKGQLISPAERADVAKQMSAFTGVSADYLEKANLRLDLARFRKELLRDQRFTLGRYDARYLGVDTDAAGERPEYDPSDTAISGAFIGSFNDYLAHDLDYHTDMTYLVAAYDQPHFDWDWKHKPPQGREQIMPDVGVDLSSAMRINPYLKVLSLNGYYDMATPFFSTEYDLAHMMLEPAQAANLEFKYYPSGHMIYLNPDALHQLHTDLADFYDRTVAMAAQGGDAPAQPK
jgi:carboxypeptidase C (cathepsin A)